MEKLPSSTRPIQLNDTLVDGYGRRLHYLRLSITDRCNQRCIYCMPPEGLPKLTHDQVLSLEEMARVAKVAVGMGVDKIRLTGGEPLLRQNIKVLMAALDALKPRPDLRITTNGRLLTHNLPAMLEHGFSTVNISLDTLRPERYGKIAGLNGRSRRGEKAFSEVWQGIRAALDSDSLVVKLNMVVLAGVNDDEIMDFARLSQKYPMAVRFIEYMPVGRHKPFRPDRFISSEDIHKRIETLGKMTPLPTRPGDGPARRFRLPGAPGELGIISALSSHFCDACNRLRLTADGRLVPCLFSNYSLDIRPILKAGAGDLEIGRALLQAAAQKPRQHGQKAAAAQAAGYPMSRLGG